MRKISKVERTITPLPRRIRACAYARVSSGKDEMLHSLAAQVSYYSSLIRGRPDYEYVGVYADKALSGTKAERPEFQRMLSDCRNGKIDLVITKSISRFARNTLTLLETARELKLLGIDIYFEEQNIHTMSGDGELMLSILASFAQEESRSVSENCKWRIRKQFEEGVTVGFYNMYGYIWNGKRMEINEEQAEVIRRVFDWYIGGLGVNSISKKLNALGIPTLGGGDWTYSIVYTLIKNEKLTGNALLQKEFVADHLTKKKKRNQGELPMYYAEHTHPAIVSLDTFETAMRIMGKRNHKPVGLPQKRYAFTGLIRCGKCRKTYKRKVSHGIPSWQCATFLDVGKSACAAKQIPEKTLIDLSMEILGMDEFDETLFKERILEIKVTAANVISFLFKDGSEIESAWNDRSRRESWTDEMKEAARQKRMEVLKNDKR
jgi:DNA invertase Pin-like site-specific DNA recombinase